MKYTDIKDDNCGIYMIKNTVNNKMYIGQSHNIAWRWTIHKYKLRSNNSDNRHLQYSWNKYGESAFDFLIVELCPVDKLDEKEAYWISYYNSIENGYNIRAGGNSSRGWKMSEEGKKNISNALKGHKYSEEHNKNLSAAQKKYYETHIPATSHAVICLNTGEKFANATMANKKYPSADQSAIHECCKGRHFSCGKDDDGNCLVWVYEEDYDNLSKKDIKDRLYNTGFVARSKSFQKSVKCITTNEVFDSIEDAAKHYGMSVQNLCGCLKGRQNTAGKDKITKEPLKWAYCG